MSTVSKILLSTIAVLAAVNVYFTLNARTTVTINHKQGPIVRLVSSTGATYCTGTVVSDSVILTAAHCVVEETPIGPMLRAPSIGIRGDDNADLKVLAYPLSVSPQLDQARLTGNFSTFQHTPYISDITRLLKIARKDQVFKACGYALGGPLQCNTLLFKDIYTFMWSTKGVLIPGMSGGPVFFGDSQVAINCAMDGNEAIVSPIYNISDKVSK